MDIGSLDHFVPKLGYTNERKKWQQVRWKDEKVKNEIFHPSIIADKKTHAHTFGLESLEDAIWDLP